MYKNTHVTVHLSLAGDHGQGGGGGADATELSIRHLVICGQQGALALPDDEHDERRQHASYSQRAGHRQSEVGVFPRHRLSLEATEGHRSGKTPKTGYGIIR